MPFYFTDFTSYKLRPSLIVSCRQSNADDYIVAFISTVLPPEMSVHDTHLIINSNDGFFDNTGLKKTSLIKCDKLMTINKSIIAGMLGELPADIIKIIDQKLKIALLIQ